LLWATLVQITIVEHRLENPRRLTFNDRDDFASDWTSDGQYILFASNRNGSMDIFRQGVDERTAEACTRPFRATKRIPSLVTAKADIEQPGQ
jgi:Tol biopolymer transport system component